MFIACNGTDRQILLRGKRTGKNVSASGSESSSRRYVPPVVSLGVCPAPSYIGGNRIGRNSPFPAIAALDKRCSCKRYRGMHGWKRMFVATVRTLFLDQIFQSVCHTYSRNACFSPCQSCNTNTVVRLATGVMSAKTSPDVRTALRLPLISTSCVFPDKQMKNMKIRVRIRFIYRYALFLRYLLFSRIRRLMRACTCIRVTTSTLSKSISMSLSLFF